jgi:hypothetical protein
MLEENIRDHHTTNGNYSSGQCIEEKPGYNLKGPHIPRIDHNSPKKIIATAKIAATESGMITMEFERTKLTTNIYFEDPIY